MQEEPVEIQRAMDGTLFVVLVQLGAGIFGLVHLGFLLFFGSKSAWYYADIALCSIFIALTIYIICCGIESGGFNAVLHYFYLILVVSYGSILIYLCVEARNTETQVPDKKWGETLAFGCFLLIYAILVILTACGFCVSKS